MVQLEFGTSDDIIKRLHWEFEYATHIIIKYIGFDTAMRDFVHSD